MPPDHYVSLFSAAIAFAGLLLVALQIRDATLQRKLESLVEVFDINRQLLSLGFSHPKLFEIMEDAENTDPALERRYLQLWLNQFSLIHTYMKFSVFDGELKESLERDLGDFMMMHNIQRHWHQHGSFYPASFQNLVNEIIKKNEPPHKGNVAAHVKSGG